ncbi:TPA: hypothetical protein ACGXND_005265 [Bacillus tropicus]
MLKKLVVGVLAGGIMLTGNGLIMAAEAPQTNSKDIYKNIAINSKDLKTNDIRIQVGYTANKLYGTNPRWRSGNFNLVTLKDDGNGYSFSATAYRKTDNPEMNKVTVVADHPNGGYIYYNITVY